MTTKERKKSHDLIRNACTENTQDQPNETNDLKVQTSNSNLFDLTRCPVIRSTSLLALSA